VSPLRLAPPPDHARLLAVQCDHSRCTYFLYAFDSFVRERSTTTLATLDTTASVGDTFLSQRSGDDEPIQADGRCSTAWLKIKNPDYLGRREMSDVRRNERQRRLPDWRAPRLRLRQQIIWP